MKLVATSGDLPLDRPDWAGITASNPFPPLPSEFRGQYLALHFRFYYNFHYNPPKKKSHRQNRLHLPLRFSEPKTEAAIMRHIYKTQLDAALINIMRPKRKRELASRKLQSNQDV